MDRTLLRQGPTHAPRHVGYGSHACMCTWVLSRAVMESIFHIIHGIRSLIFCPITVVELGALCAYKRGTWTSFLYFFYIFTSCVASEKVCLWLELLTLIFKFLNNPIGVSLVFFTQVINHLHYLKGIFLFFLFFISSYFNLFRVWKI